MTPEPNRSSLLRVSIEKLAPTGEGIARNERGTGFVVGALPGETVEAEIESEGKGIWRATTRRVLSSSPARRVGPHVGCAGCDWAHFDPAAARAAKRELFLETMERLGGHAASEFGSLEIESSPDGYRLRSRFHVSGQGAEATLGYHRRRTHQADSAVHCESLSVSTRERLPRWEEAIAASGARVTEVAVVESLDARQHLGRVTLARREHPQRAQELMRRLEPFWTGLSVSDANGRIVCTTGAEALELSVQGRTFEATAATFFQGNRYLLEPLYAEVRDRARTRPPGRALDLFSGTGFFAAALLDSGHHVISVEADSDSVRLARRARRLWGAQSGEVLQMDAREFVRGEQDLYDPIVADPPRAGLGIPLASRLAQKTAGLLILVSCDPATLARDLSLFRKSGFEIRSARLFDLFAATHRVESVVTLARPKSL